MAENTGQDRDPCRQAIDAYSVDTQMFLDRYESVRFEEVHANILDLIPQAPARVLDIGAGSGRDASALAKMGHEVIAIEPCLAMRLGGQSLHKEPNILWFDDALPDLKAIRKLGIKFAFILLSAVWMHLPPKVRRRAFGSIVNLLAKKGRLAITLRIGKPEPDRAIFPTSEEEIKELGDEFGLALIRVSSLSDRLKRNDITWTTVVFEKWQ
jgi:SAM-dependent methyltransferase